MYLSTPTRAIPLDGLGSLHPSQSFVLMRGDTDSDFASICLASTSDGSGVPNPSPSWWQVSPAEESFYSRTKSCSGPQLSTARPFRGPENILCSYPGQIPCNYPIPCEMQVLVCLLLKPKYSLCFRKSSCVKNQIQMIIFLKIQRIQREMFWIMLKIKFKCLLFTPIKRLREHAPLISYAKILRVIVWFCSFLNSGQHSRHTLSNRVPCKVQIPAPPLSRLVDSVCMQEFEFIFFGLDMRPRTRALPRILCQNSMCYRLVLLFFLKFREILPPNS